MLTRTTKWSWLKAWAMKVAARRGIQKGKSSALARRLAVILPSDLGERHGFPLDKGSAIDLTRNSPRNRGADTGRRSLRVAR